MIYLKNEGIYPLFFVFSKILDFFNFYFYRFSSLHQPHQLLITSQEFWRLIYPNINSIFSVRFSCQVCETLFHYREIMESNLVKIEKWFYRSLHTEIVVIHRQNCIYISIFKITQIILHCANQIRIMYS